MINMNEIEKAAKIIGETSKAEQVILFGSHARGDAGAHSDVDFLVIAESELPRHKRCVELHKIFKPYPFPMDILVYTPDELEKSKRSDLSFVSTVLREGKTLYERKH
jgi:predicted nucleotidyltransferase